MGPDDGPARFVRDTTRLGVATLVPEIRLHLADEVFRLWERSERETGRGPAPPPFWASAWAGGQALARYVLDTPTVVAGREVFDLASGCGVVAVAAARSGAARVVANDVDAYAVAAIGLNAEANGVTVEPVLGDLLDGDALGAGVVLAGDVFYDRDFADRALSFMDRAAARGAEVLVGDPGRAHLPRARFDLVTSYDVPVPEELEGVTAKRTTVWRLSRR
jgi:predicted nicotinamide N-methyase